jgi:hypothetical protein
VQGKKENIVEIVELSNLLKTWDSLKPSKVGKQHTM